ETFCQAGTALAANSIHRAPAAEGRNGETARSPPEAGLNRKDAGIRPLRLSTGPSLRLTSRCLTASQRHDYCYRCEKKPRRSGAESDAVGLGYSEPRTPTYRASGPWRSRPASPSGSVPNDSSDSGNDGPVDVGWLLRRGWIF